MITIRRLRIGEVDLYKRVRLEALRESPNAFSSTYEGALQRSAESWREQVDSTAQGSDRAAFIACRGDTPVGLAALYRLQDQAERGELLQVWVAPEQRGTRLAWDLMDAVFAWAADHAIRSVIASVVSSNTAALKFYQKYGFVLTDEIPCPDPGEVILIKEVHPGRDQAR